MNTEDRQAEGRDAGVAAEAAAADAVATETASAEGPGDGDGVPSEMQHRTSDQPLIVGVGASAGGLSALERLFANADPEAPIAYVVVQHLSPDHRSMMVELLTRHTRLTVEQATEGVVPKPGHVYLIPPKTQIRLDEDLELRLTEREPGGGLQLPIDTFFVSLAQHGSNVAAIVLSGTGSDGALGTRAVKQAGGVVLVQQPREADFDGMPLAALDTGAVDAALPARDLVITLERLQRRASSGHSEANAAYNDGAALHRIFKVVRANSGIDLTKYKAATLQRRVARRMEIRGVDDAEAYADLVEQEETEAESFVADVLIGVTEIFRDLEAFERLKEVLKPKVADPQLAGMPLRVWIAGCSTGEEAYSIAMLLMEIIDETEANRALKIFATDVNQRSVHAAGAGVFSPAMARHIGPGRLERFFVAEGESYRVSRALRDKILFARHDVTRDAPFQNLDLICCRNLLIYLKNEPQHHVLSRFAYALRPGGLLFLGASETVGERADVFETLDSRWRLFRKRGFSRAVFRDMMLPPTQSSTSRLTGRQLRQTARVANENSLFERCLQLWAETQKAAAVVVDSQGRAMHGFGEVDRYFSLRAGRVETDIRSLAPQEIAAPLRAALSRAEVKEQAVSFYRPGANLGDPGYRVDVHPFTLQAESSQLFFVTVSRERPVAEGDTDHDPQIEGVASAEHIAQLEGELRITRDGLQATIEELEASNEELQATNEELLSANEELQSTNEELQSTNEELRTVNAQYQERIDELAELHRDLENLLQASDIGTIFIDRHLAIRRFNDSVGEVLSVHPHDVGRNLAELNTEVGGVSVAMLCRSTIDTGAVQEAELVAGNGRSYLARCIPYQDDSGYTDGAVLSLVDIERLKSVQRFLQRVIDGIPESIVVVDPEGRITHVNEQWRSFSSEVDAPFPAHADVGADYLGVCRRAKDSGDDTATDALQLVEEVLKGERDSGTLEYPCHTPAGPRWFLMQLRPLEPPWGGAVISHLDITQRVLLEQEDARS